MVMVPCHQVSGRLSDLQFNSWTQASDRNRSFLSAAWSALGKTLRRLRYSKIESIEVARFHGVVLVKLGSADTPLC